jgi:Xaa-Pro aminopeptidase
MSTPTIPTTEYARRRNRVLTALKGACGLVMAGDASSSLHETFTADANFIYLTGISDEPGACLLLDPRHPNPARTATLFLVPRDPEIEQWDGLRTPLDSAFRATCGIKTAVRTTYFSRTLLAAAHRCGTLACLHPLAAHDQPLSPDLAIFKASAERIPGATIVDQAQILPRLRAAKSPAEIKMIDTAGSISAAGFRAVFSGIEPGQNEFDVQRLFLNAIHEHGSRGVAYPLIAGGGINSTVLHYQANDQVLEDGDVVCLDAGAAFGHYGADITRTFPVNGRFTKRQREIYNIVLAALDAAIKVIKPGVTFAKIDAAARKVITKAGYADAFIHGIGHHLGLETHDANPDQPLKVGAVVTVEPGIYLPDEKIGVRIEDDIVVTRNGRRNLTASIPRTAASIQRAMRR